MSNQEKDFLEKQIRGLMSAPSFNLSEKDYATFLQLVKGMVFEAGTSEMALAFVTIAIMDKDKFISERNNREEDFKVLIRVIIYIYRHVFENKSTLLLLVEGLDTYTSISDRDFRSGIYQPDSSFNEVVKLVRKPIPTGGTCPFTLEEIK